MKRLIRRLNDATAHAVLFVAYHTIIGPVALVRKLALLSGRRAIRESFWEVSEPAATDAVSLASPY
ncbi:hypothetical protein K8R03_00510 [Candidatus Kaiserbacteria bacterium]|nr:hypothetical protein [Candidatus Kaiserbacteria bacterium]